MNSEIKHQHPETQAMNYFSHLECSSCGGTYEASRKYNLCSKCSKPLLARYNLERAQASLDPARLSSRPFNLWRYHELLPLADPTYRLTLGEGFTPLVHARRLGTALDFPSLYIKDETLNPTGSFKARGLSVAVSKALELGIEEISIPSAGNAAGAMSAYAAAAGMRAHVFMPEVAPLPFVAECKIFGAEVNLVKGLITDCARAALRGVEQEGHFDMSTLKEPYRLEGKKTMGYEIAEQLNWNLPDVIIYPTGGGTGLVGMWKAFSEMEAIGWIGPRRPRMVAVQSETCAPIVKAFQEGKDSAEPWQAAKTIADGLRVPSAIGDFLILRAITESGGTAIAVPDSEMLVGSKLIARTEGIFSSPEGGATLAAFQRLRKEKWITKDEKVAIFVTGSGYKYYHLMIEP